MKHTDLTMVMPMAIMASLMLYRTNDKFRRHYDTHKRLYNVALMGCASGVIYEIALNDLWQYFQKGVLVYCAAIMTLLGELTTYHLLTIGKSAVGVLSYHNKDFFIWPACSGLEGVTLMWFALSCMLIIDWQRLHKTNLFWTYFLATIYMMAINILRIVSVMYVARDNTAQVTEAFHSNAGVIGYIFFICVFIMALYKRHRA